MKPSPADSPVITEFAYDKEGIVHITLDQKGYNNRKEVTLDVRRRRVIQTEAEEKEQEILNYIVEKSRRLIARDGLPARFEKEP